MHQVWRSEVSSHGNQACFCTRHEKERLNFTVSHARPQVEQLSDPALPVGEIVVKCPRERLMAVYRIPAFSGVDQFLQLVAAARGKLAKVPHHWQTPALRLTDTSGQSSALADQVLTSRCPCLGLAAPHLTCATGERMERFVSQQQRQLTPLYRFLQGGTVNVDAAARTVLSDWNDGRIPYFTEPPVRAADDHAAAAIVAGWGASFSADEVPDVLEVSVCHVTGCPDLDSCAHPLVMICHAVDASIPPPSGMQLPCCISYPLICQGYGPLAVCKSVPARLRPGVRPGGKRSAGGAEASRCPHALPNTDSRQRCSGHAGSGSGARGMAVPWYFQLVQILIYA